MAKIITSMVVALIAPLLWTAAPVDAAPVEAAETVETVEVAAAAKAAERNCNVIVHRGLYRGTENQPAGVRAAAPWGFGIEGDAKTTKDGVIAASHDNGLNRLTGGDSTMQIGNVTWRQLRSFDHPYGKFRRTTALIRVAAEENSPIMVNLGRDSNWTDAAIDTLYDAAQNHPRPQVVYFGGAIDNMRVRHEDAATFVRFPPTHTQQRMVDIVTNWSVDLVGLKRPLRTASNVDAIRAAGARVGTTQISSGEEVREAQQVGINLIQGNSPRKIARRLCR